MTSTVFTSTATRFLLLRGSDTVLSLLQPVARQYMNDHPQLGLPLVGGGTAHGYKSAIDGTTDIGMASGAIDSDMAKWASKLKIKLKQTDIAYDGIAIIVHPSNPVSNLTLDQLLAIFSGSVPSWNQFSALKHNIQIYTQSPNRGSIETIQNVVLKKKQPISVKAIVKDGLDLINAIEADPSGIGFVSPLLVTQNEVKIISVNGFLPNLENIRSAAYPIRRALSLVTRENRKELVKEFIDYCLQADAGQAVIRKRGLVPATKD